MRMTKQRQAIVKVLQSTRTHSSADAIFQAVRRTVPNISLATVYRNLRQLAKAGLVQQLPVGDSRSRFDGDTSLHYHIRCLLCGRIEDLPLPPQKRLEQEARRITDFDVTSHHVEFTGVCPRCARKQPGTRA